MAAAAASRSKPAPATTSVSQYDSDDDDEEHQQLLSATAEGSDSEGASATAAQRQQGGCKEFARARMGLLLGLAGTLTFSLMTVCVRLVPLYGPPVSPFFIVFIRGLM